MSSGLSLSISWTVLTYMISLDSVNFFQDLQFKKWMIKERKQWASLLTITSKEKASSEWPDD